MLQLQTQIVNKRGSLLDNGQVAYFCFCFTHPSPNMSLPYLSQERVRNHTAHAFEILFEEDT